MDLRPRGRIRALLRDFLIAIAPVALCACAKDIPVPTEITEVVVSEAIVEDFYAHRGAIDAQRVGRPPPAAGLTHGGDADGVVGVILWAPEPIFRNLGFRDGDKIVAIDRDSTDSIYSQRWEGYGRYPRPSAFGTDKYTGLMADIFRRRSDADSTLVILHRKLGSERQPDPIGIRLLFEN